MPTLRQKVDAFCKDAGAKVESTDKLRAQITSLKAELKKAKETHKNHMKEMKTAAKAPKMTDEEKGQRRREKAVVKELEKAAKAKAAPPKQAVAMNPLPPAMPQTATVASAGRRTRRHRRY